MPDQLYAAGSSPGEIVPVDPISLGWGSLTSCLADSHATTSSGSRWNRLRLNPSSIPTSRMISPHNVFISARAPTWYWRRASARRITGAAL